MQAFSKLNRDTGGQARLSRTQDNGEGRDDGKLGANKGSDVRVPQNEHRKHTASATAVSTGASVELTTSIFGRLLGVPWSRGSLFIAPTGPLGVAVMEESSRVLYWSTSL